MRGVLVAIDLETTGLDAKEAEIIEIGAAKFRDHDVIETFSTLIDPGTPIPQRITDITGIRTDDVRGKPKIAEALPALLAFVGDAPLVGHNIDFDLKFLHKQNVLKSNVAIDTYELAAVLLPSAARYNLNALMQLLNIAPEGEYHRALTDAIADARLYMAFWDRLLNDLPFGVLREIAALGKDHPWKGNPAFQAAVEARSGSERASAVDPVVKAFKAPPPGEMTALMPRAEALPVDADKLAVQLAFALPEGQPPDVFPRQQAAMRAVCAALNGPAQILLEAPDEAAATYLLPAAVWAAQNGQPVVIAAATERRRTALLDHDIPAVAHAADLPPLRTALLRPRRAYLCPAQINLMRQHGAATIEELRLLAKTLIWLGERANAASADPVDQRADPISIRGLGEQLAWSQLNAEGCTAGRCESEMEGACPLHQARKALAGAHLIVTDHGTLADDRARGAEHAAIPPYGALIIDEAALLEENVTYALRVRLDTYRVRRELTTLGIRRKAKEPLRGLLGAVLDATRPVLPEKTFAGLEGGINNVAEAGAETAHHIGTLFAALRKFFVETADARPSEFSVSVALTDSLRGKNAYAPVREAWDQLKEFTGTLIEVLPRLVERLRSFQGKYEIPRLPALTGGLERMITTLGGYHRWLESFLVGRDKNAVQWAEIMPDADRADPLLLHSAPLHLGTLLEKHVYAPRTVLADSLLQTRGRYDYLMGRLGAEHFEAASAPAAPETLPAPLLLVYMPNDMAEPNDKDRYHKMLARGIIELAAGLEGRIAVMFTGYTALRQVAQMVAPRLALGDIPLFDQSDGTSQTALLDNFRAAKRAVLMAVRGFWDEANFTADDLDALIVVRLPFPVPSEPVYAARADTYRDSSAEFTTPQTVLRFHADIAGLLRGRRRRGVLAILDRRTATKDYGKAFLEALPNAQVTSAPLEDMPSRARHWLIGEG